MTRWSVANGGLGEGGARRMAAALSFFVVDFWSLASLLVRAAGFCLLDLEDIFAISKPFGTPRIAEGSNQPPAQRPLILEMLSAVRQPVPWSLNSAARRHGICSGKCCTLITERVRITSA